MLLPIDSNVLKEKFRLWRTLFIHRWHAPQTIGELHGRPSVGIRFEHINHTQSLVEHVWRFGSFAENKEGTGRIRVNLFEKNLDECGLEYILKWFRKRHPDLLNQAVEYTVLIYGSRQYEQNSEQSSLHKDQLIKLAEKVPDIKIFAKRIWELHREMLIFYHQMRYITYSELQELFHDRIPILTPLRNSNSTGPKLNLKMDAIHVTENPVTLLRSVFYQNIYNSLCWRARSELLYTSATTVLNLSRVGFIAIYNDNYVKFEIKDDPALVATLASLAEEPYPSTIRFCSAFKTAVSTMITAMPMFIVKNFFRDTLAAFVAGRYWQTPFFGTISGGRRAVFDLMHGDELVHEYVLQGGFYSGLVESEVRVGDIEPGSTVGTEMNNTWMILKRIAYWLTRPAWVAEAGTRLNQYERARMEGATPYKAIRASRMVSSDFANIGASRRWRMYVHTVPFLNAAIQGFDQLYQVCRPESRQDLSKPRWGEERKQHVRKTLTAGSWLIGVALAVCIWNTTSDDRSEQYIGESEYKKASYLTIYDISGDADLRIPVPFQIGAAFIKVPEIGFDLLTGTDTLAGSKFAWSLVHGNLAVGWLPAVVQPVWEVMTNRNFFGAPIIPGYMWNWPPERQFYRSTPEPLVAIGSVFKISPLVLQTFVRGWTGHLGNFVVTALDEATWDHGEKPFPRTLGYATGLASIWQNVADKHNRWSEEFYELSNWAAGWRQESISASYAHAIATNAKSQLRLLRTLIYREEKSDQRSRESKERYIIERYADITKVYRLYLPLLKQQYRSWKTGQ